MTAPERMVTSLTVKSIETGETLHTVPLGKPLGEFSRGLEMVIAGLLRNINRERFFVAEEYEPESKVSR